jgi:hypothetical protein
MSTAEAGTMIHGEFTEKALQFCQTLQRLVAEAKQYTRSTIPADFWDPLKAFIAIDEFQRCSQDYREIVDVGAAKSVGYDARPYAKDVLDFSEWFETVQGWALSPSLWEYTVMRVAEFTIRGLPAIVYMELEERGGFSGQQKDIHWSNTIDLFEFNEEGKIRRFRLGVADYALRTWPVSWRSSKLPKPDGADI